MVIFSLWKKIVILSILMGLRSVIARAKPRKGFVPTDSYENFNYVEEYSEYDFSADLNAPFPENAYQTYENDFLNIDPEGNSIPYEQQDVVLEYTRTFLSKLLVAAASTISNFAMLTILLNFVLSNAPITLTAPLSCLCMVFTFLPGDLGDYSRSSGVFFLLLLRQSQFRIFLPALAKQVLSAAMLSRRHPFPDDGNPWRFKASSEQNVQNFQMKSVLIGVCLLGAFTGWFIASKIPLFPNWIGTLGGAGFATSVANIRDGRGDLLRFIGYSSCEAAGQVSDISNRVKLTARLRILSGRFVSFIQKLDKKHQLLARISGLLAYLAAFVAKFIRSVRKDANNEDN